MRFGYCANINFLLTKDERSRAVFEAVLDAGYDYIELPLSAMLKLNTAEYASLKLRLKRAGVPCRANFLLFPHELPLVGAERNLETIAEHTRKVLPIAADLGSEVVVFGNGGSRRVREGMSAEQVRGQLVEILRAVEPVAAEYGVQIALEPLCSRETNMVNSYPEAARMAREGGAQIGAVCDLYHVITDGQLPDEILEAPDKLFHLHIACPAGRTVPSLSDDPADYRRLKEAARKAGYDRRLSIEANMPEGDTGTAIREGLTVLRGLFS